MEGTIILFRGRSSWQAWMGGKAGDDSVRLFGTRVLPTPFGRQADPMVVLEEVRARNPEYRVVVG